MSPPNNSPVWEMWVCERERNTHKNLLRWISWGKFSPLDLRASRGQDLIQVRDTVAFYREHPAWKATYFMLQQAPYDWMR